jgi:Tol biopolymer transport system component
MWGIDDGYISWIAKRWVETDTGWTLGKCGIWKQSIAFDTNGDVTGLTGTPSLVWESTYRYSQSSGIYWPLITAGHDWSPDGTKIAFDSSWTDIEIHVGDTTTGTETDIADGCYPRWSPDGNMIAFMIGGSSVQLKVIKPDGTGEKTLVQATHKGDWINHLDTFSWSPDSTFLSYDLWKTTLRRGSVVYRGDIFYIGADGSGNTCVSKDLTQSRVKIVVGWR